MYLFSTIKQKDIWTRHYASTMPGTIALYPAEAKWHNVDTLLIRAFVNFYVAYFLFISFV